MVMHLYTEDQLEKALDRVHTHQMKALAKTIAEEGKNMSREDLRIFATITADVSTNTLNILSKQLLGRELFETPQIFIQDMGEK